MFQAAIQAKIFFAALQVAVGRLAKAESETEKYQKNPPNRKFLSFHRWHSEPKIEWDGFFDVLKHPYGTGKLLDTTQTFRYQILIKIYVFPPLNSNFVEVI